MSVYKESDDKMSDDKMSDDKMSDDKMSDDKMSDEAILVWIYVYISYQNFKQTSANIFELKVLH